MAPLERCPQYSPSAFGLRGLARIKPAFAVNMRRASIAKTKSNSAGAKFLSREILD
jgi:hypothetical protein